MPRTIYPRLLGHQAAQQIVHGSDGGGFVGAISGEGQLAIIGDGHAQKTQHALGIQDHVAAFQGKGTVVPGGQRGDFSGGLALHGQDGFQVDGLTDHGIHSFPGIRALIYTSKAAYSRADETSSCR